MSYNQVPLTATKYRLRKVHTHPFNGPFSGTTRVSRYQKGKTDLDFTEARDSEWQWHQLGHMQVCISLQTDNHASTPPLKSIFIGRMPFLPPNQQRQSTEGKTLSRKVVRTSVMMSPWLLVLNCSMSDASRQRSTVVPVSPLLPLLQLLLPLLRQRLLLLCGAVLPPLYIIGVLT